MQLMFQLGINVRTTLAALSLLCVGVAGSASCVAGDGPTEPETEGVSEANQEVQAARGQSPDSVVARDAAAS